MSPRSLVWLLPVAVVLLACAGEAASPAATEPSTDGSTAVTSDVEPVPTAPAPSDSPPTDPATTGSAVPTVPTATTGSSRAGAVERCVRVEDFDDAGTWFIVNDGVMGGRSDARAAVADSTLRFSGEVVTAGGGFTSIRRALGDDELGGSDRVRVRLRSDGRTYGLTLEDDQTVDGRPISHRADLPAEGEVDGDGFVVVEVPYASLEPSVFGFGVEAEPFRAAAATEIGLIIADGVDGPFTVDVDWIDVCR